MFYEPELARSARPVGILALGATRADPRRLSPWRRVLATIERLRLEFLGTTDSTWLTFTEGTQAVDVVIRTYQ